MEVIALQEYTDKYISLYEGEIRNIPADLALYLIYMGIVAQHDEEDDQSSSGGVVNYYLFKSAEKLYREKNGDSQITASTSDVAELKETFNSKIMILKECTNNWMEVGTNYLVTKIESNNETSITLYCGEEELISLSGK